jgi:hypothetical protein
VRIGGDMIEFLKAADEIRLKNSDSENIRKFEKNG